MRNDTRHEAGAHFLHLLLTLTAIPFTLFVAKLLDPPLPEALLDLIYALLLLSAYPPLILRIFVSLYKPLYGPGIVILGMIIRLTALGALSFWLRIVHADFMRSGLVLFLAAMGGFLTLEIIGMLIVGLKTHNTAKKT